MDIFTLILICFCLACLFYLIFLQSKKKQPDTTKDSSIFSLLKQDLDSLNNEIKDLKEKNVFSLTRVSEEFIRFNEISRRIESSTEDMKSIKEVLSSSKKRGNLGELNLEWLLEKVFSPKQFEIQHEFKDGDIVDAALFVDKKILPIDSKFPLENYNKIITEKDPAQKEKLEKIFGQDLKNRIDEVAKYIKPQEGTFDFALMFIPAEGIYVDLMNNEVGALKVNTRDLLHYAVFEKNVFIVSPNTFYVCLNIIFKGLRAFEIDKQAEAIIKKVGDLQKHILAYDDYMKKLGNNIATAVKSYNTAYKEMAKIDKDVVKITNGERQIEPLEIDKPEKID
ncbi:DNA recombination protein RmuC [Candidatus Gribaldobacteria bacterium]|nr:DNA recombination protein RmuC [Candidatus Gribaldobacteria bacterium]